MWHPNEDATPTPEDVEAMAAVLEGQHGDYAVGVAEFFARMHGQKGDAGRAWAWQGVAARINKRAVQRTGDRQATPRDVPRA